MLENYTPDAKRVIFFARYEAGRAGATSIDIDHLILGIGRVDRKLIRSLKHGSRAPEPQVEVRPWWRRIFESRGSESHTSTSTPIPFSDASKRVLAAVLPDLSGNITPEAMLQAIAKERQAD